MKIRYIHISAPETVKVHDTALSLRGLRNTCFYDGQTQEEWDDFTLRQMAADKAKGFILDYEVLEGA